MSLSPNEREFLQDDGTADCVGSHHPALYKCRVKKKFGPILVDAILLLKYANKIELGDYLKSEMYKYILELKALASIIVHDVEQSP